MKTSNLKNKGILNKSYQHKTKSTYKLDYSRKKNGFYEPGKLVITKIIFIQQMI